MWSKLLLTPLLSLLQKRQILRLSRVVLMWTVGSSSIEGVSVPEMLLCSSVKMSPLCSCWIDLKMLLMLALGLASKNSFSVFLCFFDFLWSSSISIDLKALLQGWHFHMVDMVIERFELASTNLLACSLLTSFLLVKQFFWNRLQLCNLSLGIVNVEFCWAVELVAGYILEFEAAAAADDFLVRQLF